MKRSEAVQRIAEAIHKDDGGHEGGVIIYYHRAYAEAALREAEKFMYPKCNCSHDCKEVEYGWETESNESEANGEPEVSEGSPRGVTGVVENS